MTLAHLGDVMAHRPRKPASRAGITEIIALPPRIAFEKSNKTTGQARTQKPPPTSFNFFSVANEVTGMYASRQQEPSWRHSFDYITEPALRTGLTLPNGCMIHLPPEST